MTTLVVAGCGLLGTSVARAYRRLHPDAYIVGIEPDSSARQAASGLSVYSDLVSGSDDAAALTAATKQNSIGIAATPPALLAQSLLALAPLCDLVMDVGSIKGPVIDQLQQLMDSGAGDLSHVIPCHPMAGSEDSGPGAGDADLFTDRWVFVVPTTSSSADKVQCAHEFWAELGARTQQIDAQAHDQAVAYTSHLPHLLASAYMDVERPLAAAAGTGFMGFTRLAKANPEMWSQVLIANHDAWAPLLQRYIERLQQADTLVSSGDAQALGEWLARCRDERLAVEPQPPGRAN